MKFLGTQTVCFCVVVSAKCFFRLHHPSLRSWRFFGVFFILWFAENNGGGGEGKRPLFESSIYYTHESASTHNVNTGDKSVWYIFLYTGNIFYVHIIKQTNWVIIYT